MHFYFSLLIFAGVKRWAYPIAKPDKRLRDESVLQRGKQCPCAFHYLILNAEFGGRQEAPENVMKKLYSLLLVVLLAGLAAQGATNYGIKVAGVSVTSANASNVTGSNISGSVTYNNSTKTLTMTNVTINLTSGSDRALLNTGCSGLTVKFVGTCSLTTRNKAPIRTECSTTLSAPASSTNVIITGAYEGAIFMDGSTHTLNIEGPGNFNISTFYCPAIEGAKDEGSGVVLQTPYYVVFSNVTAALSSTENDMRRLASCTFNSNSHVLLKATNNSSYSTVSDVGIILNGNEAILTPAGAYVNNSDKTIKDANGNNIHDEDVYISDNYAFIINSTNFTDANFRNYMLGLYPKGYLTQTEVQNLTSINVSGKGISNMKGVELLTYLQKLTCNGNSFTSLDLSGNTRLTQLSCYNNSNMTSLNVNNCTQLNYLDCSSCKLTTLTLSNLSALQTLYCYQNKLTSISFASSTPYLESVHCYGNNFTTFSLNGRPSLKTLNIKNCTSLTILNCYNNALTTLDVTGNTALTKLDCSSNSNLASITGLADCTALQTLYCEKCALTSLSGINSMSNLRTLSCYNNKLTSLSIYNMTNLTRIDCQNNPNMTSAVITDNSALTTLNIKNCPALTTLKCYNNNLSSLDMTGNTALTDLRCNYNSNLTNINGLEDCTAMTYLNCEDCGLYSLIVQNMTNIGTILASNNRLTGFSVYGKSQLTYLRLSGNTTLTALVCYNNALTTLNITGCTALTYLSCYGNSSLSSITGLADCTNLEVLLARDCNFSSLNVANKTKLETLNCSGNQLTSLSVSGCNALSSLSCYANKISGTGMTTLVNSLPNRSSTSSGALYAIHIANENNSMTSDQVTTARNKNWLPKKWNGSDWVDIQTFIPGDVDGNGQVNIADVSELIDLLLSGNPSVSSNPAADVDGDGNVGIADVSELIDKILNS